MYNYVYIWKVDNILGRTKKESKTGKMGRREYYYCCCCCYLFLRVTLVWGLVRRVRSLINESDL